MCFLQDLRGKKKSSVLSEETALLLWPAAGPDLTPTHKAMILLRMRNRSSVHAAKSSASAGLVNHVGKAARNAVLALTYLEFAALKER